MANSRLHPRFEQVPLHTIPVLRENAVRPRVLNVSLDATLLQTRSAILQSTGAAVVNANGYGEAVRACARQAFDAVVLCHALPRHHKREVMQAARRGRSATKVVGLYNIAPAQAAGADVAVDSHDGPEALLQAVRPLL